MFEGEGVKRKGGNGEKRIGKIQEYVSRYGANSCIFFVDMLK